MKPIRLAVFLSITTLSLAACSGNSETSSAMSSATSAASSAMSSATSAASSAMAQPSGGDVTVEVDGSPLQANFMNITCTPGDSNDDDDDADDLNEGPELNIESQKGEAHELDIDINNPDDNPTLDNLDIDVDTTHLDTEDAQEMAATVTRDGNTWTIETDAFHSEGTAGDDDDDDDGTGKVARVKVSVTCPS